MKEPRNRQLNIKLTDSEHRQLYRNAGNAGMSAVNYARQTLTQSDKK